MTKLFLIFSFLLTYNSTILFAQKRAVIEWQKSYGGSYNDGAGSVCPGVNGGYVIGGGVVSNDGDVSGNHGGLTDGWVVCVDNGGKMVWQKCLGGSGQDNISCVYKTGSGYIAAGLTQSTDGDVTHNHGIGDAWIVSLSSTGSIIWQRTYGGTGNDAAFSIISTNDGGYIFSGGTNSNDGDVSGLHSSSTGADDAWIVKLDATGNIAWQKCLGGSGEDQGLCIQQTSDSGYIICGATSSNDGDVIGLHDSTDIWVVKLDTHGALQWQKCLGGSRNESSTSIHQTADGGYIIGGNSTSADGGISYNHGGIDYWIIKLDAVGAIRWQKTYGGTKDDQLFSIIETSDKGYIMTGTTISDNGDVTSLHTSTKNYSDEWVVRIDDTGRLKWQRCLGGSGQEQGAAIIQVGDSEYVAAGSNTSSDGDASHCYGSGDYWLVKLGETDTTTGVLVINTMTDVKVYPTVTNSTVHLSLPDGVDEVKIRLVNINGQEIKTKVTRTNTEYTIEIPQGTAAGMLVVQILTHDGIVSRKIVYRP